MRIVKPSVTLLWITPDAEKQIELAGRTCYKSEDKITDDSARDFCRRMRISGHHAMIEHASASFRVITDRGVTHEIVRHRIASYAQESTRYCNYSNDKFNNECSFIQPDFQTLEELAIWEDVCAYIENGYMRMEAIRKDPQLHRSILPNSLKTEIVMTCNMREWRHFIGLRGAQPAHPQIRPVAYAVWCELMKLVPSLFEDLCPLSE